MTFQKTAILMKTTQAPEIKLTPFVKSGGRVGGKWWEERERKREKEKRPVKEKSLSGCSDAFKNHIAYQAHSAL